MSATNLEMFRGDMEIFDLTITRGSEPVDLTDAKIWMTARRHHTSSPVFMKTTDPGGGITLTDAEEGLARVTLTVADTSELDGEQYVLVYDIQVRDADGLVFTPIYGTLTVTPDVTTETE